MPNHTFYLQQIRRAKQLVSYQFFGNQILNQYRLAVAQSIQTFSRQSTPLTQSFRAMIDESPYKTPVSQFQEPERILLQHGIQLEDLEQILSSVDYPDIYCPISLRIMLDPVLLKESNQTYERSSIYRLFTSQNSDFCPDPLTRIPVKVVSYEELEANVTLKGMIANLITEQVKQPFSILGRNVI